MEKFPVLMSVINSGAKRILSNLNVTQRNISFVRCLDKSTEFKQNFIHQHTCSSILPSSAFYGSSILKSNLNFTNYVEIARKCFFRKLHASFSRIHFPRDPEFLTEQERKEEMILFRQHKYIPKIKPKKKKILDRNPQMRGVVLKTLIKKPKKPNSANRKCVLLRLTNGKEVVAHVPGEGHNLQEHHVVLVEYGRTQDVPGLKLKVIRGKYDCAPVIKKKPTTAQ